MANDIRFDQFGQRDLDRYLVERQRAGRSQLTIHHDAICAKGFMARCQKNDLLDRSRLSEYIVRKAPTPPKYMPTHEDMVALVSALRDYWNVEKNPNIRYEDPLKRAYHREPTTVLLANCQRGIDRKRYSDSRNFAP